MNGDPGTLGKRVAQLRERRGWTQRHLANKARLSPTFVSEIENDKRNISSEVLLKLADALATSLDYLLRGESPPAEREPDVFPPALAAAAEARGWSYAEALDTLKVRRTIVARCSERGAIEKSLQEWTQKDWVKFHRSLFK